MLYLLKLIFSIHLGIATNFAGHDDEFNPVPYAACLHRDLKDTDLIIAHKTLPCHTRVLIYAPRTKRYLIAKVGDRGPAHQMVDLNVAVTKKLHANGAEPVILVVLP